MSRNTSKVLLVTANVGSIFEDPNKMLKMWLKEFLSAIKTFEPEFLAVHCQEVGGKNYEESMAHVNSFVKALLAAPEMQQFDKARVFLDEDFTAVDKFTALGNLYFIHQDLTNVQIYDFVDCKFVPIEGREVLSGNIENVTIKEKAKFPQEFFPDFKWSRKGFIRTRWNINNTVFDLINLHLFHDASNITAMSKSPSEYNGNRCRTLRYTIDRFANDSYDKVPYFLFGDFNFRLDTHTLIKKLTETSEVEEVMGKKGEISKILYKDKETDKVLLSVEKKGFLHHQHNEVFSNNNGQWLHAYDLEPQSFEDKLVEYSITFPPSYPFSEDTEDGVSYMKTRCPSWCDRIMLSYDARDLIYQSASTPPPEYDMMGTNICMGDHKPIYLNLRLRHSAGNDLPTGGDEQTTVVVHGAISIPRRRSPLKKVISINGEEVDIDEANIHDFTRFENDEYMTPKFIGSLKRKTTGLTKKPSFKNLVKDVMRTEKILKALRHYTHRSDTEESETEEEGTPKPSRPGSRKRRSRKGKEKSKTESVSEEKSVEAMSSGKVEDSNDEVPSVRNAENNNTVETPPPGKVENNNVEAPSVENTENNNTVELPSLGDIENKKQPATADDKENKSNNGEAQSELVVNNNNTCLAISTDTPTTVNISHPSQETETKPSDSNSTQLNSSTIPLHDIEPSQNNKDSANPEDVTVNVPNPDTKTRSGHRKTGSSVNCCVVL